MRALEFQTTIKDNKIQIPQEIQAELNASNKDNIKVMIFLDDQKNDKAFERITARQFLNGYDDSDSIYDEL